MKLYEAIGWVGANKARITVHNDKYVITVHDETFFTIQCEAPTLLDAIETTKRRLEYTLAMVNEAVAEAKADKKM